MAIHSRSCILNTYYRRFRIRKKNALLNLVNNQPDIGKIYLYAKDSFKAKYQYSINNCEKVALDHLMILKLL